MLYNPLYHCAKVPCNRKIFVWSRSKLMKIPLVQFHQKCTFSTHIPAALTSCKQVNLESIFDNAPLCGYLGNPNPLLHPSLSLPSPRVSKWCNFVNKYGQSYFFQSLSWQRVLFVVTLEIPTSISFLHSLTAIQLLNIRKVMVLVRTTVISKIFWCTGKFCHHDISSAQPFSWCMKYIEL